MIREGDPFLHHRGAQTAAAVAAVVLVAAADRLTSPAISLRPAAVLVVAAASLRAGRRAALLAAVVSAAAHALAGGAAGTDRIADAAILLGILAATAAVAGAGGSSPSAGVATTDALTGAMDRRSFRAAAEALRRRAELLGDPLSVAYLDVDGFKAVNDRHGHQTGDRILADLAGRVTGSIRTSDLFCRIGGDEFVLLLPGTDATAAARVLQRARTSIADHTGGRVAVTVSIGIATFLIVPTSVDAMIDAADRLMYRAKRGGPDRIVGAVVAGPWMRSDQPGSEPAIDVATVRVEIVPAADPAPRRRRRIGGPAPPYTPGAAYRESQ